MSTLSSNAQNTDEHQDVLNTYEAHCSQNNIKLTALKKEVLKHVISLMPVKAYRIIEQLQKHTGHTISPPLVYRALDFFLKKGLVHKLEKLHAYVICKHPLAPHTRCVLFHCTTCRNTLEICDSDFHDFLKKSEAKNSIQVDESSLELYGTCGSCSTF